MEIHYDFRGEHHPLYSAYRQLEARLLRTGMAMSTQEHDTWIAAALAKAGYSSDLIASALLYIRPALAHRTGEGVQDYVAQLVEGVMQLPEVREAQQALFGADELFDEDSGDDADGPIFFGGF
jgi:RepB DNA-primase C-terminal helical domain